MKAGGWWVEGKGQRATRAATFPVSDIETSIELTPWSYPLISPLDLTP